MAETPPRYEIVAFKPSPKSYLEQYRVVDTHNRRLVVGEHLNYSGARLQRDTLEAEAEAA